MNRNHSILGISAYYHDSAACLVQDGEIVAAAQEERFTRKKHDSPVFRQEAVMFCLREGGLALTDVNEIVFYDKPLLKFERLLETYLSFAPKGHFVVSGGDAGVAQRKAVSQRSAYARSWCELGALDSTKAVPPILFGEHHESHAAAAFFPSPYQDAAVLCMDGVGEWATTSAWVGHGNQLTPLWEIPFPHSPGSALLGLYLLHGV